MKKSIWWIVGLVILVIIVIIVSNQRPSETGTIKIGFMGPLSGDGASYGETEKNATELAISQINSAGGINGRQLEVVYEDSKGDAKDALSAIQKLIDVDGVKIVLGGGFSSESLAAAPIADQNKVLMYSAFSSNPKLSGISKYFFRSSPSDSQVAKTDADTMISQGFKKVAIISENTDYSLGVRDIMKKMFASSSVTVVYDKLYNTSSSDFKTILAEVKTSGADVLYINPNTSAQLGGILVKQVRQLGITIPIHGNYALASADALAAGGSYMNGIIVSDSPTLTSVGQELLNEYKQKYGADPASKFDMGSRYDSVKVIVQAIKKVGLNTDDLVNYLRNMPDYNGTIGTYHFNQDGDVIGVSFQPFVIKDGKETPLQP